MKVSKNFEELKFNNKYGSLIIKSKKKKINKRGYYINDNDTDENINNDFHTYCNTTENKPIETYSYSNINLNFKKNNKLIYFKNKFKKDILLNNNTKSNSNTKYILRGNTIDFKEAISPIHKGVTETKYNKYIFNNITLRKNKTGLNINKNNFKKDNGNSKIHKSFKNLKFNKYKLNLYSDQENKIENSMNYMSNNNNRIIEIKNKTNKKNDFFDDIIDKELLLNSNNNSDEVLSKELFNLLVKKLNISIEENEKGQKIIKKLMDENNKLKQKLFVETKKNEINFKKKNKEINDLKKNNENLKKEKEKLQNEIIKLLMSNKEIYNNRNKDNKYNKTKDDNVQLNQLDSICSSIGGISGISYNISEK